jgi:hypothetical protein
MTKTEFVLRIVDQERNRQDWLVQNGGLPFNCADLKVPFAEKARVIGEEYGEVCRASYEIDYPKGDARNATGLIKAHDHLFDELVQLAATAVAWAESLVTELRSDESDKSDGSAKDPLKLAQELLKDGELQRVPAYLVGQLKERLENFNRQKNEWKPLINANQR